MCQANNRAPYDAPFAMEDIRFVLEAPQNTRAHKKRPRLVTSCDNCRMKKIKCIQPSPNVVCEACSAAHVPCRFRDRERYFAERSRMVSAASASSKNSQASKQHVDGVVSTDLAPISPTDAGHKQGSASRPFTKRTSGYHPYQMSLSPPPRPNSQSDTLSSSSPAPASSPLFDSKQSDRPRSTLMMTFIQVFFDNLNIYFPFLAYDETIRRFFEQELSALQANCIAALAARYTDAPEITERGAMFVTDQFCDTAKSLASSAIAQGPDLDTLHSLILLAWVEFNRNRLTEFCHYGQMAIHMAVQLGLTDEKTIKMAHSEYEQQILQSTMSSITILQSHIHSCLGVRV